MRDQPSALRTAARASLAHAVALLACLVLAVGTAAAEPVERHVLAVYDSTFEPTSDATLLHARAEMPLNHLGYVVEYRDAASALPDPAAMDGYAAVITWFTYDLSRPADYLAWARRVSARGVPFIVLGQVGAPATRHYLPSINTLLAPLGIVYTGNFVAATSGTTILASDPDAIGFERPLDRVLPGYPVIRRVRADAPVLLEVQAPARERLVRSALVTAGERGAFVPNGFALHVEGSLGHAQWTIDPFDVFGRVLGTGAFPVPDTTTFSGRRLFYSMVDGDGWNDDSTIAGPDGAPAIAAEVLAERLLEAYPDLPATVGVIGSDFDEAFGDGARAAAAARRIFALPQVEVASHSATSPQQWSFFEDYDRAEEERLMAATSRSAGPEWLRALGTAFGIVRTPTEIERNRALYLSGSRPLPRAYLRDPFSLEDEVVGAAAAASALAPADKRATIYSWSGDAKPFAGAIRATRQAGLRNINGGGSGFDSQFPSIGQFGAIARVVGGERQIHALGASGGTDDITGESAMAGFSRTQALLAASESPVRLKGAGLHYHAFATKTPATLRPIRDYLDWARGAALTPVTASQYAAVADGFFTTRIERIGEASWLVTERDGLQTVRFDEAGDRTVDIGESIGVIGSTLHQGSLYVALDPAVAEVRVVLRSRGQAQTGGLRGAQLAEANWLLSDVSREDCSLRFAASGFGTPHVVFKDVAAGAYRVEAASDGESLSREDAVVSADGGLRLDLPQVGTGSLDVAIRCVEPEGEQRS